MDKILWFIVMVMAYPFVRDLYDFIHLQTLRLKLQYFRSKYQKQMKKKALQSAPTK